MPLDKFRNFHDSLKYSSSQATGARTGSKTEQSFATACRTPLPRSVMATDMRFVYASVAAKDQTESSTLTIQLPTTSANLNNSDENNNSNNIANTTNSSRYLRSSNDINTLASSFTNAVVSSQQSTRGLLDCCQHQAATRGLLLSHNDRRQQQNNSSDSSSSSTNVLEGDELANATPPPNYHEIPGIVPSYHGRTSGPPPAYDDVVNPNACPPSYQSLFGQVREARKTSNGVVDLLRQLFLVLIGTIGCTMIIGFLLLIPVTMILVGVLYVNECRAENIPVFLVIGGFVWIIKNMLNCYNQFKRDSSTSNHPPPRNRIHVNNQSDTRQNRANSTTTDVLIVSSASPRLSPNIITSLELPTNYTSQVMHHQNDSARHSTRIQVTATTTRGQQQTASNHIRNPPIVGLTSYKCESILNYFLIVWFLAGCIVVYRIYEPDYDNPLSATYCNRTVYLYAFWFMTSAFIIMGFVLSCLCCLMASSFLSCNHGR